MILINELNGNIVLGNARSLNGETDTQGISLSGGVSSGHVQAVWGQIQGDISNQEDLNNLINANDNIYIVNVTMSSFSQGTADKTSMDIFEATQNGKIPVVRAQAPYGVSVYMTAMLVYTDYMDELSGYTAIFVYENQKSSDFSYATMTVAGNNVTVEVKQRYATVGDLERYWSYADLEQALDSEIDNLFE